VAGPLASLSGHAALSGLILNENKRPDFVPGEQGVSVLMIRSRGLVRRD
jgi:hypothetical protein